MSGVAVVTDTARRVSALGLRAARLEPYPPGTLLFAMYASVGEISELGVRAVWNQALLGLTPRTGVSSRFLKYALISVRPTLAQFFRSNTQNNLNAEQVGRLQVPSPPPDRQIAVADYLDRETARIDELIGEQEELARALTDRRFGLVAQAVAGSGDGWTEAPLKRFVKSLDHKRIPLSAEERAARQGDIPYFGASGVIDRVDGYLFDDELLLVSEDGANLLARSTPIAFVVEGKSWVNNHAHVLRVTHGPAQFWAHRIESLDVSPWVTGAAQPKLTADALLNLPVSAPCSPEDARRVAASIDTRCAVIDDLLLECRDLIALLKERRAALITAAVTGQIDVRAT